MILVGMTHPNNDHTPSDLAGEFCCLTTYAAVMVSRTVGQKTEYYKHTMTSIRRQLKT